MTLAEYTVQYSQDILPLKKPATQVTFKSHFKKLNNQFGEKQINDITNQEVQRFFTQQYNDLSPKSLKNLWATFRVVLEQAKRDGHIEKLPEPVLPKAKRIKQDWLTPAQMKSMIQAAPTLIDKTFYWLLAETGVRIGEALGLRQSDVDLVNQTISINQSVFARMPQEPKTELSIRVISVSTQLRDLIETIPLREYLFSFDNRPWPVSTLFIRMQNLMREVGIEPVGFHAWRRGNATLMSNAGVPEKIASGRQGHSLPGSSLTFNLYAQFEAGMDKPFVEKIVENLL